VNKVSIILTCGYSTYTDKERIKNHVQITEPTEVQAIKEYLKSLYYPFSASKQQGFRDIIDSFTTFYISEPMQYSYEPQYNYYTAYLYGADWHNMCHIAIHYDL
jgi:hypothetical protein